MNKKVLASFIRSILLLSLVVGVSSCKNQKKLTELSENKEDQIEEVDESNEEESLEENTEGPEEVGSTDSDESDSKKREIKKEPTKEAKLTDYFTTISQASSTAAANGQIQDALQMFSNSSAPVLIVIYKSGGQPSYDQPTTIEKYLNYLKDTKNKAAQVEEIVYDSNGKIKELVLRK
ncbi:MAG: hypothetical protein HRT61_08580 [Ekhidna sp.]|nr:hypothetical protein [Ekhidna sp.]